MKNKNQNTESTNSSETVPAAPETETNPLVQENRALAERIAVLEKENGSLTAENAAFKQTNDTLNNQVTNLTAEKSELIGANTLAAGKIAELSHENAELKERLALQATNLKNANAQASQALEANGNLRAQIATKAPSLEDPAIRAQVVI
jgi:chromosome segregation ATPase